MNGTRHDVIMAGVGGKGVLIAGQLLAKAALGQYQSVSWTPTYFTTMRGGACECTVIMTNGHLGAPVVPRAGMVLVFDVSQLADFQSRVAPRGTLIVESAGLPSVNCGGIEIFRVPAISIAAKIGDIMAANFVLLGAYMSLSRSVRPDLVEAELTKRFGQRPKVLELNLRGLSEGQNFARAAGNSAPQGRGT